MPFVMPSIGRKLTAAAKKNIGFHPRALKNPRGTSTSPRVRQSVGKVVTCGRIPNTTIAAEERTRGASVEKQDRCGISGISRRRQENNDHGAERDRRHAVRPGAHDPEQRDRADREEDAHGVDKRRHPVGDAQVRPSFHANYVAGIDHTGQTVESSGHAEHAGCGIVRQKPLHWRFGVKVRQRSHRRAAGPAQFRRPLGRLDRMGRKPRLREEVVDGLGLTRSCRVRP